MRAQLQALRVDGFRCVFVVIFLLSLPRNVSTVYENLKNPRTMFVFDESQVHPPDEDRFSTGENISCSILQTLSFVGNLIGPEYSQSLQRIVHGWKKYEQVPLSRIPGFEWTFVKNQFVVRSSTAICLSIEALLASKKEKEDQESQLSGMSTYPLLAEYKKLLSFKRLLSLDRSLSAWFTSAMASYDDMPEGRVVENISTSDLKNCNVELEETEGKIRLAQGGPISHHFIFGTFIGVAASTSVVLVCSIIRWKIQ